MTIPFRSASRHPEAWILREWTRRQSFLSQADFGNLTLDLLSQGSQSQAMGSRKQIHWAAGRGDREAIEEELARGADVNCRNRNGETPLMLAAQGRRADLSTLKLLIAAGADVNAASESLQKTALQDAASSGRADMVRFLLSEGANVRFASRDGCTALNGGMVFWGDDCRLEVLEELLKAGAEADGVGAYFGTPLMSALSRSNFPALAILLRYGASREPAQMTSLMWAIALGTIEEIESELRKGGDLAARDRCNQTPWIHSVKTGDVSKAKLLLRHGASADELGVMDWTGLIYAASLGHVNMTRWLLSLGAPVEARGEFACTAMGEAVTYGRAECVRLLLEAGAEIQGPVITKAANIETVHELLKFGADINAVDSSGYCLLSSAAEGGNVNFARQLIAAGAAVDPVQEGETALHKAAMWDHSEIVSLLLEHGADPNAEDYDSHSPVSVASTRECRDLLLAAGGRVRPMFDIKFEH